MAFLPKASKNINKKVLVIDLDETLFKSHEERTLADDIEVNIESKDGNEKVFITLRPYALSFLNNISKKF